MSRRHSLLNRRGGTQQQLYDQFLDLCVSRYVLNFEVNASEFQEHIEEVCIEY